MPLRSRNIVFVHGMFGWGPKDLFGLPYWGRALECFGPELLPHEAKCGPISSLHDRACEVFAQIVGARVDYGAAHSLGAGHARFGPDYSGAGFVPGWSRDNPVILVGHSAGAMTCLQLQKLLAGDFWGVGSTADWAEVVVSIAGALNGSLLSYLFSDEATGLAGGWRGRLLARALGVAAPLLRPLYDLGLEHWLSQGRLETTGFLSGEDNLIFNSSLQGARQANDFNAGGFATAPNTYYLAFVTGAAAPKPQRFGAAGYMARRRDFAKAPIPGWGQGDLAIARWRANDGVVSSISQRYPFTAEGHPVGGEGIFGQADELAPGRWRYEALQAAFGRRFDHLDPVHGGPRNLSSPARRAHREFYERLNALLVAL